MNDEHIRLPQWLKVHRDCEKLIASGQRRFCKDCAHRKLESSSFGVGHVFSLCDRPVPTVNWVDGSKTRLYCESEREEGECGPSAKFFEKKPEPATKKNSKFP